MLWPAARGSQKTCKITILLPKCARGFEKTRKSGTLCFCKRLDVVPGEKGYEDSGLGGFPAPDGARMSAHFTVEPLAAPAGLRNSKRSKEKQCDFKANFHVEN